MKYLVTGSRVYGVAQEDSDLDIVMEHEDALKFKAELKQKGFQIYWKKQSSHGGGAYVDLCGIEINIVTAQKPYTHNTWAHATREMRNIPPIVCKTARAAKFISLCEDYNKGQEHV